MHFHPTAKSADVHWQLASLRHNVNVASTCLMYHITEAHAIRCACAACVCVRNCGLYVFVCVCASHLAG